MNDNNTNTVDESINIIEQIEKYLVNWKWFLLSCSLALIFAFVKLNFSRPSYRATASIKIENEKNKGRNELSAFQDLSMMGLMSGNQNNIEDEIEILKSKSIVSEAIKSLNLNVSFFDTKSSLSSFFDNNLGLSTEFYTNERYDDPPLKINFFSNDSIIYRSGDQFIITPTSVNNFIYKDIETETEKKVAFGQKFSTSIGDIIITPIVDLNKQKLIGKGIFVTISSLSSLTKSYALKVKIEPVSELSSVVTLEVEDGTRKKAEDFLNTLIKKYNDRAIFLKEELAESTSKFVEVRLEKIESELSDVDKTAESVKTKFRASDAVSSAGLNLQASKEIENQILQTSTQIENTKAMKDYVSSKDDNDLLPVSFGVGNNSVSNSMIKYNELMLEKKRLLKNSTDKNPTVVHLNEQLQDLKNNIGQGLESLESTQSSSLDALNKQDALINARLYSAPRQERQIRDVQRQQGIKEKLYLYLLTKREETALTLGVADPNAKIIDYAESLDYAVAPKKPIILALALILGLAIPFIIIYLRDLLDSKIHTKEDVTKVLSIPVIGDIPKLESNQKNYIIKKDDYSSMAEAFRILRTNLSFILPEKENDSKGKTIFVTSTIAHEGKSLVSTNLATALAHAEKKTLILGMDIRAPRIKSYLGVRGKEGVTNYIVDAKLTPEDIIVKTQNDENLHIVSSGDLAPNPAELLMNNRVATLFDYARENYDYIIVDTAAFSMVTDTLLLSKFADAFIYTIRANFLDKRMLAYVNKLYNEKRLSNMVILLNGVDHKKSYGYGYGYGYGTTFDQSKKAWWRFGF